MKNPLVTVFITAYNSEKYITECLMSVINQTYKNLEIIVIDDGSKDSTNEIIRSFKDKRIKLITNIENMGIPYNRKKGMELAKGKYLAIIDSDDIAVTNRIDKQVKFMEDNPDILAAGTYFKSFGKRINNRTYKAKLDDKQMQVHLLFRCPILNSSSIIRLKEIRKNEINYNPNYFIAQDYGIWADISKIGKIVNIPEVLVKYRFGHNNITKVTNESKASQRKKVISSIHNDLLDFYGFNLTNEEKEIFNNVFNEFEPHLNDQIVNKAGKLIVKMIATNQHKEIFDTKVFNEQLNAAVEATVKWSSVSLIKKIKYWYKMSNKSVMYIVVKSIFFSIRQFIKKSYIALFNK